MPQRVTLKDIAREAGVSAMTVSQVLNTNRVNHASPKTREKIREIAQRLNYMPNLNARRLVTRKSDVIGVLMDRMAPTFQSDVAMELETLAVNAGYRLQIAMYHESLNSMTRYINDFQCNGLNAVLCLGHAYPEFGFKIPSLLERFERVVFMEKPMAPTRFPYVSPDHYLNFRTLTAKMLKAGYRRVISIRSNYRDNAYYEAQRGMRDAYFEAGIPYEENFWLAMRTDGDGRFYEDDASENLEKALTYHPDALILSSDETCLRTIRLLKAKKIRVPEDLGLFSATLSRFGALVTPSFSGIDYNAPVLARSLFDCLIDEAGENQPQEQNHILVPSNLIWRESTRNVE